MMVKRSRSVMSRLRQRRVIGRAEVNRVRPGVVVIGKDRRAGRCGKHGGHGKKTDQGGTDHDGSLQTGSDTERYA